MNSYRTVNPLLRKLFKTNKNALFAKYEKMLIIIFSRAHHQNLSFDRNLLLPKTSNFIPAIYAMFNMALGFSHTASHSFPFAQTSVGDTLTWGRSTFTPRSRNSFSPGKRERKAQGNRKRERKFLLPATWHILNFLRILSRQIEFLWASPSRLRKAKEIAKVADEGSRNFKLFSSCEIHFITSNYFVNIRKAREPEQLPAGTCCPAAP